MTIIISIEIAWVVLALPSKPAFAQHNVIILHSGEYTLFPRTAHSGTNCTTTTTTASNNANVSCNVLYFLFFILRITTKFGLFGFYLK